MANFIKLHDASSFQPLFINMDTIEVITRWDVVTELVGIRHWNAYKVEETPEEILALLKGGAE